MDGATTPMYSDTKIEALGENSASVYTYPVRNYVSM